MAKMTKKGRNFVSDEISHLMKEGPSKGPQKGKKMPQKQAVAVALDVARRKGFKSPKNPNESLERRALKLIHERTQLSTKTPKEENVSIFDALVEGDLPEAFKKNVGKWKIKGGENPDAKKKGADYEGPDDDDKPDFMKKKKDDDSDMECESTSIFDSIVESEGSVFDTLLEESEGKSAFDDLVESTGAKSDKPRPEASWDDRMARTLTLAEELVSLRDTKHN